MRFNEFKLRQWEKENLKEKRWRMYDVVIEIKNIRAESKEDAERQALDLIVSPFPANIRIEAFEKGDFFLALAFFGRTEKEREKE